MFSFDNNDNRLYSVFQPIYGFSNQSFLGAEALVRGANKSTGHPVSVRDCLHIPSHQTEVEFINQLNTTHLKNWQVVSKEKGWLFLNLDFQKFHNLEDLHLENYIRELTANGQQLVVEIVESEIFDEVLFEELIFGLRALGCMIAIDDFGAGHSNIDRIWKAEPDIVKLDRQVLVEATKSVRKESILRNLSYLINQSGSITLLEGVETEEQALLAMDVGVDLVQGFYFAKPEPQFEHVAAGEEHLRSVINHYPQFQEERVFRSNIQKQGYDTLFHALDAHRDIQALEQRMVLLSQFSFVKRYFILDEEGYQISDEGSQRDKVTTEGGRGINKVGKGLCWNNRRYFQKAMKRNDELYVSKPYRSLIDLELCLTVSRAIVLEDGKRVVACFDVMYHDKSITSVQIST